MADNRKQVIESLNELLSNMQLHYQRCRNFHWNVSGPEFFQLHVKFEEYYNAAALEVDEVAERILSLGASPLSNFTEYLKKSTIKESDYPIKPSEMVLALADDFSQLATMERAIFKSATEEGDDRTADMVNGFATIHEKNNWMLMAWLGKRANPAPVVEDEE